MDEHRIGLKPITRGVWAPKGERPIALGHHRYEWLYVHGFVEPATGRTVWNVSNVTGGVNPRIDGEACAGEDKGVVEAPGLFNGMAIQGDGLPVASSV